MWGLLLPAFGQKTAELRPAALCLYFFQELSSACAEAT